MADFKTAMFQKRIEKVGELKPVTILWENQTVTIRDFQTLQQMMKKAVESDLANVNVTSDGSNNIRAHQTQVERLKEEIFRAYLFQTKDFQESIYGDDEDIVKPIEPPVITPPAPPAVTPPTPPAITPPAPPAVTSPAPPEVTPQTPSAPSTTDSEDLGQGEKNSGVSGEQDMKTGLLLAWVSSARTTSQTIRWKSVSGADGYSIYGAKSKDKYKLLKTVGKSTRKWKQKKLKKGTEYKYHVEAYKIIEGKQVVIADSLPIYSRTDGGKYGNPVKLKVKKSSVRVKSGKKFKLKVKMTGIRLNQSGRKISYLSADPSIAKVTKKGAVTGVRTGTTDIYCIARNGLFKKIRVIVR